MSKKRNTFQRESIRESLSRSEAISPEAGVDLNQFGRPAAIRVYKKRWLILILFTMFVFGTKLQWLQYTMILNVIVEFFKVSTMTVKATAMIYSASFIVFLYPIIWLIHKRGLRIVLLIASASVCLGTWIKYFAISPDQFSLILIGQCFVGTWQVVCSTLPPTIAAVWFGPNEVATAMALTGSGTIFGIAVSSLVGPFIVKHHDDFGDIGKDLNHYTLPIAFYCTCVLFLVFFFFSRAPKLPPSKARALQKLCTSEDLDFFKIFYRLLKNRYYLLLWNAHGLIGGAMLCIGVSLNLLYLPHFKHEEQDIGRLKLVIIVCGYFGAVTFCMLVDKYKIYKLILVILSGANILAVILLGVAMYFEIRWTVYLAIAIYGFIAHGYFTTAYEHCSELTYPEPVPICIAVLNAANQIYSSILVVILNKILVSYSDIIAYGCLTVISIIGFILTCTTRDERRRQNAGNLQNVTDVADHTFEDA